MGGGEGCVVSLCDGKITSSRSSRKHFFGNGKVIQYVYGRAAERGLTVWAADEMSSSYSGEYTRSVYSGRLVEDMKRMWRWRRSVGVRARW